METSESRTIAQVLAQTAASEQREGQCDKHGPFVSRKVTDRYWTRCPTCQKAENDAREAETERRMRAERMELRRRACGVPLRFLGKTFADFVADTPAKRAALEVAQGYAKSFPAMSENGTCLAFCGTAGTGKTHLAAALVDEVIRADYEARFVGVMQAIRSVKETYRRDSEQTEGEALKAFVSPDLLVLDEVGVQFGSDAEKLILFEIINTRYERILPTVVISNLAKDGLQEFLGERAFDRLRENGGKLVVFDWESYRRKSA